MDNSDIASIANSEIKHTSEMSKLARIDTTKRNNSAKIIENKPNNCARNSVVSICSYDSTN